MKIERFEDLECWKEARKLVNMVYKAINSNTKFKNDLRLKNQCIGAVLSIMGNIPEGFARRSNKEFIQFLFISISSGAELQSHFYIALDQNYVTHDIFDAVYNPPKTRLIKEAERIGCDTISGVEMFINQAVVQFEHWTGEKAPEEVMRKVVLDHLAGQ